MKQFKYDLAISLCKEDVEFARKLVKAINPNITIFFYEHRQEELISKSGPEVFANIFKHDSRVVLILSRKEWGKSYYTGIERGAITDRTVHDGFSFIMVIPMIATEIPDWYPATHIYADPFRFTIEELAKFIEFKIANEGGEVRPLTLEEQYEHLLDRIAQKRNIIQLQHCAAAIASVDKELFSFKEYFNHKSELLKKSIFDRYSHLSFRVTIHHAHIGYGDYLLDCAFQLPGIIHDDIKTTQDVLVAFELSKTFEGIGNKKLIDKQEFFFIILLSSRDGRHLICMNRQQIKNYRYYSGIERAQNIMT